METVNNEPKCTDCKYCVYANSGYICELSGDIVILDFTPTEFYYSCGGKDFEG